MTAEIIPIEPEQVMLLRENRIKDEVHPTPKPTKTTPHPNNRTTPPSIRKTIYE